MHLNICFLVSFRRKPVQLEHFILQPVETRLLLNIHIWLYGYICCLRKGMNVFFNICLALSRVFPLLVLWSCSWSLSCFAGIVARTTLENSVILLSYILAVKVYCQGLEVFWLWFLFFLVQDKTYACCAARGSKMIFVWSLEFNTCWLATLTRFMISLKIYSRQYCISDDLEGRSSWWPMFINLRSGWSTSRQLCLHV